MGWFSRLLGWRPGLRAGVLTVCALLICGIAIAVSVTVSDHLAKIATAEAIRQAQAVVSGVVDPMFVNGNLAASPAQSDAIDSHNSSASCARAASCG